QPVFIMLVECIECARFNLEDFTGFDQFNRTGTLHAIHAFQMIFVMDMRLGAGINYRVMHGKAHVVFLQQQTAAAPGRRFDVARGVENIFQFTYDHAAISLRVSTSLSFFSLTASATACSRISRPASSCSCSMVNGINSLTTSS